MITNTFELTASEKGERGAMPRQREWSKIPVGEVFYAGTGAGEKYQDIVVYTPEGVDEAVYYECMNTHDKGTITPDQSGDWREMQHFASIATYLFFANRALVKNLVVEEIVTADGKTVISSGRVVIDGVIYAKEGTIAGLVIENESIEGKSGQSAISIKHGSMVVTNGDASCRIGDISPSYASFEAICRMTNSTATIPGASSYGLILDIINPRGMAKAIKAKGAIFSDHYCQSSGVSIISPRLNTTHIIGPATSPNPFNIIAKVFNSNANIGLPNIGTVCQLLDIPAYGHFAVRMSVLAYYTNTHLSRIYAKNYTIPGMGGTDQPQMINHNGDPMEYVTIGRGDFNEFMLCYDGIGYVAAWLTHTSGQN